VIAQAAKRLFVGPALRSSPRAEATDFRYTCQKLEEVVRNHQSRPPSELSDHLLSEIRLWRPASLAQQDDITLMVIDVV
jgi:hypothetical protein